MKNALEFSAKCVCGINSSGHARKGVHQMQKTIYSVTYDPQTPSNVKISRSQGVEAVLSLFFLAWRVTPVSFIKKSPISIDNILAFYALPFQSNCYPDILTLSNSATYKNFSTSSFFTQDKHAARARTPKRNLIQRRYPWQGIISLQIFNVLSQFTDHLSHQNTF